MKLSPGDKVRIIQHAFENDLISNTLVATKGSIGTVLSYDELIGYVDDGAKDDYRTPHTEERPTFIKKWIDEGEAYPIRFETVVPPSEEFCTYWEKQGRFFIECEIGKIDILHVMFLEKIS